MEYLNDVTIDNIQDKCYFIGDQANTSGLITEFDFRFGPYFVRSDSSTGVGFFTTIKLD